jgi:hypothetical protein
MVRLAFNVTSRKMLRDPTKGGVMVDPLDPGTIALPLACRRARGRPRKVDALSPAERARRYRVRRKQLLHAAVPRVIYEQVASERDEAREKLRSLRDELEQLRRLLTG